MTQTFLFRWKLRFNFILLGSSRPLVAGPLLHVGLNKVVFPFWQWQKTCGIIRSWLKQCCWFKSQMTYMCGCAKRPWRRLILIVSINLDCVINCSSPVCSDTPPPPSPPPPLWSPLHGKEVWGGDFFNQAVCLLHTSETKRRKLPNYANVKIF